MAEEFKDTKGHGNNWHTDLEQFMADLFDAKKNLARGYWCMDGDVKYINLRIDTRDLGYLIHADGRGNSANMENKFRIHPDDVRNAIKAWDEKYNQSPKPAPPTE